MSFLTHIDQVTLTRDTVENYQKQAEDQRKESEKLDKKFEVLSEESKGANQTVKKLKDRIAKASSAPR